MQARYSHQIHFLSESAILISFESHVDEGLNQFIIRLADGIRAKPFPGFRELVGAYASLTLYFSVSELLSSIDEDLLTFFEKYLRQITDELEAVNPKNTPKIVEIPVSYDGEDLSEVMNYTGLSKAEVIKWHTTPLYRVYLLGFLPGFPYLGGLLPCLHTPRRVSPRTAVPAGSVGIGGAQTGIYPLSSPGGWQLIGRTDFRLITPEGESITALKQGDYVRFLSI